jgi:DNA-binding IscR family transcriptional regulator
VSTAWELSRVLSPRDRVRVMKRDAYGRLDENSYPLFHQVGPTPPATPWALRLADAAGVYRLLCFDFDGKEAGDVSPELMERAVDDCDELSALLHAQEVPHVVCQSSGTGGRHIWVAPRDGAPADLVGALARAARARFRTLDHGMLCNPAEGAARPPLSPHRDGSTSTLLRGSLEALTARQATTAGLVGVLEALEALRPAPRAQESAPSGPVNAGHRPHRRLSRQGEAHMGTIDGGSNPSWTGFMCLLSAAVAGWTLRDVEHAVRTAPGMEHYRTKNTGRGGRRKRDPREAQARLERQWDKAQQYAALYRPLPAEHEPRDYTELIGIVDSVEQLLTRLRVTPGRWTRTEAAHSQVSVLQAVAFLTLQTGKQVVAASIRDLALMTGLGRTTAATALHALQAAGFIQRVTGADQGNAAEWRLTPPLSTGDGTVRSQPLNNPRPPTGLFDRRAELIMVLENTLVDARHDLFTRAGLGHLAGRTYALLRQHAALTVESAAVLLGMTARHMTTIMSRLRRHRLIISHVGGWARSRQDLRTQAARTVGVDGYLVDRAHRYSVERETWQWWLAELTTMNSSPKSRPRRQHVSSRPLFEAETDGERIWPRYPRSADRRADHKSARSLVFDGFLNPESRFQYLGDVA